MMIWEFSKLTHARSMWVVLKMAPLGCRLYYGTAPNIEWYQNGTLGNYPCAYPKGSQKTCESLTVVIGQVCHEDELQHVSYDFSVLSACVCQRGKSFGTCNDTNLD